MLRVTKNNINISWDENYDWKDFSNIVLKSIFSTLKFENIEKRVIIDVYFIDNKEMKKLNDNQDIAKSIFTNSLVEFFIEK